MIATDDKPMDTNNEYELILIGSAQFRLPWITYFAIRTSNLTRKQLAKGFRALRKLIY